MLVCSAVSAPTISANSASVIFSSCPFSAFVAGVKIGSRKFFALRKFSGKLMTANFPARLIILPAGAFQIAAHDAFDRKNLGLFNQRRAPRNSSVCLNWFRHFFKIARYKMILRQICETSNQNAESAVKISPFCGIVVGITQSNAEIRSVATSKRRFSSI